VNWSIFDIVRNISFWVILAVVLITMYAVYTRPDQAKEIVPVALAGLFGVAQGIQRFRTSETNPNGGAK